MNENKAKSVLKNLERIEQMLITAQSLLYDTYFILDNREEDVEEFETKRVITNTEE